MVHPLFGTEVTSKSSGDKYTFIEFVSSGSANAWPVAIVITVKTGEIKCLHSEGLIFNPKELQSVLPKEEPKKSTPELRGQLTEIILDGIIYKVTGSLGSKVRFFGKGSVNHVMDIFDNKRTVPFSTSTNIFGTCVITGLGIPNTDTFVDVILRTPLA